MEVCRRSSWLLLLLGVSLLATTLQGVQGEVESEGPSESECRPYIEKALKELETGEADDDGGTPETNGDSTEDVPTVEITTDDSEHDSEGEHDTHEDGAESTESVEQNVERSEQEDVQAEPSAEDDTEKSAEDTDDTTKEDTDGSQEAEVKASAEATDAESKEGDDTKEEESKEDGSQEAPGDSKEDTVEEQASVETGDAASQEEEEEEAQASQEGTEEAKESNEDDTKEDSNEDVAKDGSEENETKEDSKEDDAKEDSKEDDAKENSKEDEVEEDSKEDATKEDSKEGVTKEESREDDIKEDSKEAEKDDTDENDTKEVKDDSKEEETKEDSKEEEQRSVEEQSFEQQDSTPDEASPAADSKEEESVPAEDSKENAEPQADEASAEDGKESTERHDGDDSKESGSDEQPSPEEELSLDIEIPTDLRERDHVEHLLKIDDEASETESIINKIAEITLRELKKLYENAIKPLEGLYKYRDLSNRHFGDSEIFSKPLILFMGPWSGGKSSIINYLLDNEYNETSLRTGAEPSPAYFNILMYGEEPEIIDGTQLAADFTFSGLQKFGQGLEERLRGVKLPNKLLERVNIVEIPGILEVRKQVSRVFPFNDACQWFIDRADIIFLVYDPSKLDVGPETEAILDQLKGREHQTRIILNKADQVKPEELMRVQGALIWNISPLMSSAQPPVMYTTSLWSRPYEVWAPTRLLQAQERAFLRDLRSAIDKRIENKIASARRFAVRVRNHAKMVDCYLTTYYNHKSVFGNRKQVAEQIIEHPQDYHIYEGLSTLTNISRYDLPDPDVYKDFFKLNPLYEFQQLSATCTYFRGCPINRLDVAIAYDLPELVGKHKRLVESALGGATQANQAQVPGS